MLRVVVYTAKRYERAMRAVVAGGLVGAPAVLTSPPVIDDNIVGDPTLLEDGGVLVLNLHGRPLYETWFGDGDLPAIHATTLASLDLRGVGVFAINCYAGDDGAMRRALWAARPDYVVSGRGINWGGAASPIGADLLLRWFLRGVARGMMAEAAIERAKRLTYLLHPRLTVMQREALRDTLEFTLMRAEGEDKQWTQ